MRLWHYKLIPYLDRQRLLAQHRECCALRGKGWGKKHSTIDYIFKYPHLKLWNYHFAVMQEMQKRGYNVSGEWLTLTYRGKSFENKEKTNLRLYNYELNSDNWMENFKPYDEHDDEYFRECIKLLIEKGSVPVGIDDWSELLDVCEEAN